MTSNIGSEYIVEDPQVGEGTKKIVTEKLKASFKPEFINRIDDIIVFKALDKENVRNIIRLLVKEINERLREKFISVDFTPEAIDFVIDKAYDLHFGARPLKRYLQREVETNLAKLILRGDVLDGDTIRVTKESDALKFEVIKKAEVLD
jgi:ATP-dependent Clp protease ATP-binding subunit ClpB